MAKRLIERFSIGQGFFLRISLENSQPDARRLGKVCMNRAPSICVNLTVHRGTGKWRDSGGAYPALAEIRSPALLNTGRTALSAVDTIRWLMAVGLHRSRVFAGIALGSGVTDGMPTVAHPVGGPVTPTQLSPTPASI